LGGAALRAPKPSDGLAAAGEGGGRRTLGHGSRGAGGESKEAEDMGGVEEATRPASSGDRLPLDIPSAARLPSNAAAESRRESSLGSGPH
jgi:hypothetical protein